ncbi:Gfo/Idh/MocA family protein [Ktedonospora formicarum]|uniref:Oxidoreductase n=1 Tax=Ktedonospora formicarum TaxID=2778364 RepID=A0A8J3MRN8_9CHLR|nr:Gfo/Idh/MocA family oxidoreductase [Ktedonospora formicarum]GHO42455.1 oxidoreductase [Ktedonospora formicarum]
MQKEETLRVVLVGCGSMSGTWIETVQGLPGVEIVGLVDIRVEAAQSRAQVHHLTDVVISSQLTDVLEQIHPDVVFNCTIPEAHYETTLEALEAGCHVLSEKPMADSLESARKLISAAQRANRRFAVMQNRRYDANIRRAKAYLATGELGSLTTVNSDFYIGAHFGGFRDEMHHVLLLDMAIHTFDAARFLTGANPVSVYCQEWNPADSWYTHGASAVAIFEMTGGLIYTYRGSWCAEGLPTTWESDWRLIAPQGSMKWDGGTSLQVQQVSESGKFLSSFRDIDVPSSAPDTKTQGHASAIEDFISCLREDREPETAGTDNIKSLAMVFAAIESAETGKRVEISW